MSDAGAGAHDLNVSRFDSAFVAKAVSVSDCTFADIGDDLDIGMHLQREAGVWCDLFVVPRAEAAPTTSRRIDLRGKAVTPGLIDNHMHLLRAGTTWLNEVRFDGVDSRKKAIEMRLWETSIKGTPDSKVDSLTTPPSWLPTSMLSRWEAMRMTAPSAIETPNASRTGKYCSGKGLTST